MLLSDNCTTVPLFTVKAGGSVRFNKYMSQLSDRSEKESQWKTLVVHAWGGHWQDMGNIWVEMRECHRERKWFARMA